MVSEPTFALDDGPSLRYSVPYIQFKMVGEWSGMILGPGSLFNIYSLKGSGMVGNNARSRFTVRERMV